MTTAGWVSSIKTRLTIIKKSWSIAKMKETGCYEQEECGPTRDARNADAPGAGGLTLDPPCLEWAGAKDRSGYGQKRVGGARFGRTWYVHRLAMAEAFGEEAIDGKVVAHRCDNPACYRVDHLFITDQQGNLNDMVAKGRSRRGAKNHNTKLDEDKVREVRTRWASKRKMAEHYGVSTGTIQDVLEWRTWTYV